MNEQIMNRADLDQQLKQKKAAQAVQFDVGGHQVSLSIKTVRDYLVTGDKERVSDQEVVMFINLCKFAGLNPWMRDAYCIKYGNEPATMVVGRGAFEKRADSNPMYDGFKAGIIVHNSQSGVAEYREGMFYDIESEKIVGGWAEVYRKDRSHSTRAEVPFDEYAGRKRDGTLNGQWSKKPGTMIRKVALVQALREAFPNSFTGMYDAAEMGVDESTLGFVPVDQSSPAVPPVQDVTEPVQESSAEPEQLPIGGGLDDL